MSRDLSVAPAGSILLLVWTVLGASLLAAGCSASRSSPRSPEQQGQDGGSGVCTPGEIVCSAGRAMICEQGEELRELEDCQALGRACERGRGCVGGDGQDARVADSGGPGPVPEDASAGDGPPSGPVVPGGPCDVGQKGCLGTEFYYCLDQAGWTLVEDCAATGKVCAADGCAGCDPGELSCRGPSVLRCAADGLTQEEVEVCGPGSTCQDGACISICGMQDGKVSYQGCEYWAVDLDNADVALGGDQEISPRDAQLAVAISNVDQVQEAEVRVYLSNGPEQEEQVGQVHHVAPGSVEVIELPPRNVVESTIGFLAYRLEASMPVIAYQFNPLNNTEATYSAGASLLLPTNALDTGYIAVTGDGVRGKDEQDNRFEWTAFVTVVGVASQPTRVAVTLTSDFLAPPGAQVNGRTVTATLARYEVLSIASRLPADIFPEPGQANLSGSTVQADRPVAVFAGNVATAMPVQEGMRCCADHMEEQLFPTSSWGRKLVAGRGHVRRQANPEADYWRLTAQANGTQLSYQPARPQGAPSVLDAGQSVQFHATGHFLVEASQPVLLAQFLSSSQVVMADPARPRSCVPGPGADEQCTRDEGYLAVCRPTQAGGSCQPISDPSMLLVPPIEQYRDDYVFLTPLDYLFDFVNIMAPAATEVRLDGQLVEGFVDAGTMADGSAWRVATIEVEDGSHHVQASRPVGLMVYGYDRDISYGYPGGLNLERINRQ